MISLQRLPFVVILFLDICLFLLTGFLGEAAFGGLAIYGPSSPPKRPINWHVAGVFVIVIFICSFVYAQILFKAGISLGDPDIPSGLKCLTFLVSTLPVIPTLVSQVIMSLNLTLLYTLYMVAVMVPCYLIWIYVRGFVGLSVVIVIGALCSAPSIAGTFGNFLSNVIGTLLFCVPARCKYLCHHRITLILGMLSAIVVQTGSQLYLDPSTGWYLLLPEFFAAYLLTLWFRRKRSLPPALRNCRFVRLGYLRQMAKTGMRILRNQDMPLEAWGDPSFAEVLIITSHRWLNRYTCDVVTNEYPCGLRLGTMIEYLNKFYPEVCCRDDAEGQTFCTRLSRLWLSMAYGGYDVLIFFDFMALPQIGLAGDGTLLPRTNAEEATFSEALPAMGALYTMHPVLVLPEVTEDAHPYWSSGWCFSEFASALLTERLGEYSSAIVQTSADIAGMKTTVEQVGIGHCQSITTASSTTILEAFEHDLATKQFFNQDDCEVVRGIVKGFLLLRQLQDAVKERRKKHIEELLAVLLEAGLRHTLDHAVGPSLDTLLHLAVQGGDVEVTSALLQAGSSANLQNLRGDTPSQWFMLPRCSSAAALCRQARQASGRPIDAYQQLNESESCRGLRIAD